MYNKKVGSFRKRYDMRIVDYLSKFKVGMGNLCTLSKVYIRQ